jgi:hypothetical protein
MFYVPSLGIYAQMSSPQPVPIFINRKLNWTSVIGVTGVTGTVAKEIAAKQPELPF